MFITGSTNQANVKIYYEFCDMEYNEVIKFISMRFHDRSLLALLSISYFMFHLVSLHNLFLQREQPFFNLSSIRSTTAIYEEIGFKIYEYIQGHVA